MLPSLDTGLVADFRFLIFLPFPRGGRESRSDLLLIAWTPSHPGGDLGQRFPSGLPDERVRQKPVSPGLKELVPCP